jgi:hypothetical protein
MGEWIGRVKVFQEVLLHPLSSVAEMLRMELGLPSFATRPDPISVPLVSLCFDFIQIFFLSMSE